MWLFAFKNKTRLSTVHTEPLVLSIDKKHGSKNAQIIKKRNVWHFVRHNNKITIAGLATNNPGEMCKISAKNGGASLKEMSNQIYWLSLFDGGGGRSGSIHLQFLLQLQLGLIEMWKANDSGRRANNVHLFSSCFFLSLDHVWLLLVALVDLSCTFPFVFARD